MAVADTDTQDDSNSLPDGRVGRMFEMWYGLEEENIRINERSGHQAAITFFRIAGVVAFVLTLKNVYSYLNRE